MIKNYIFDLLFLAASLALLTGCIKSEPLNSECDIVTATLPGDVLNRAPEITNDAVTFYLKPGVAVGDMAPEFTLTPGATIVPPSGTLRDFASPQTYVVTSENGQWHKTYTVRVDDGANLELYYDFNNARVQNGYYVFYIGNTDQTWASANAAYLFTGQAKTPEDYPTYQVDDPELGLCVALTTRSTGIFGSAMKKPIAAGSIFLGKFDSNNALANPLGATHFGRPFFDVPLYLHGKYKFVPGEKYRELNADGKLVDVPGKVDECNVYSVLFEVTDDMEWLDGNNVLSPDNPNIVAVARFSDDLCQATDGWTEFNLPYVYRKNIDIDKFLDGKYSFTIVASSSKDGDFFAGAVGSTLVIKDFSVTCISDYQDQLK